MSTQIPKSFQNAANLVAVCGCGVSILAMSNFGAALRKFRKKKKLSQDKMGEKAGVNGQTISNIEKGGEPRGDTYHAIMEAFPDFNEELAAIELPPEAAQTVLKISAERGVSTRDVLLAGVAVVEEMSRKEIERVLNKRVGSTVRRAAKPDKEE